MQLEGDRQPGLGRDRYAGSGQVGLERLQAGCRHAVAGAGNLQMHRPIFILKNCAGADRLGQGGTGLGSRQVCC